MDIGILRAFSDEMKKIAKTLNRAEEREQALRFTGLGAAAMPVAVGAGNAIAGGKKGIIRSITGGAKMHRWLPAQATVGAVMGGGIPTMRHKIERGMQEKAKERREADKLK